MSILKIIQVALKALNRNKMRTFLTMLGIIVGVVAVIAMISIGQGANASIQNHISSLGTNLLFINSGSSFRGGINYGSGSVTTLTADDAEAIAPFILLNAAVAPLSIQFIFISTDYGIFL